MAAAYSVKYSAKRIKKWEKDYTTLKIKEQEDLEEVRVGVPSTAHQCGCHGGFHVICGSLQRLRAENRMLRQKVSMLETESGQLAERLVRGQVSCPFEFHCRDGGIPLGSLSETFGLNFILMSHPRRLIWWTWLGVLMDEPCGGGEGGLLTLD